MEVRDTVQLKSGGPVMNVDEINGDDVICVWTDDEGGETQIDTFAKDTLVLIQDEEEDEVLVEVQPVDEVIVQEVIEEVLVDELDVLNQVLSSPQIVDSLVAVEVAPSAETEIETHVAKPTPCRCINTCPTGFCTSTYNGGHAYNF